MNESAEIRFPTAEDTPAHNEEEELLAQRRGREINLEESYRKMVEQLKQMVRQKFLRKQEQK